MAFTFCAASFPRLCLVQEKKTNNQKVSATVSIPLPFRGADNPVKFLDERAKELAQRHQVLVREVKRERPPLDLTHIQNDGVPRSNPVNRAYDLCGEYFFRERDPFAFGSSFMNPDKRKALWAIWTWGRRVDELADGINASHITSEAFDRWNVRLNDIFHGRPWDIYDVALCDTLSKFPLDEELFYELVEGTRFDLEAKKRYQNFEELCLYQYYATVDFFFLLVQTWGFSAKSNKDLERLYSVGMTLGLALMQVDMLRDVGDDAKMGRIYLPQDELAFAGITEDEIFEGKVTKKWRYLMERQIKRTRKFLDDGGKLIYGLNSDAQPMLRMVILLYGKHLDAIEANDYDNLTKRVPTTKVNKLVSLLVAYARSLGPTKATWEGPPRVSETISKYKYIW